MCIWRLLRAINSSATGFSFNNALEVMENSLNETIVKINLMEPEQLGIYKYTQGLGLGKNKNINLGLPS